MVNLVLGQFIDVLSDFSTASSMPDNFMANVTKFSSVPDLCGTMD
jgi:hypothetical protein